MNEAFDSSADPSEDFINKKSPAEWDKLDQAGKVSFVIDAMSEPRFLREKKKINSSEEKLLDLLESEPGLVQEIVADTYTRGVAIFFIQKLYRSGNGERSFKAGERARQVFSINETPIEKQNTRNAQLDCIIDVPQDEKIWADKYKLEQGIELEVQQRVNERNNSAESDAHKLQPEDR